MNNRSSAILATATVISVPIATADIRFDAADLLITNTGGGTPVPLPGTVTPGTEYLILDNATSGSSVFVDTGELYGSPFTVPDPTLEDLGLTISFDVDFTGGTGSNYDISILGGRFTSILSNSIDSVYLQPNGSFKSFSMIGTFAAPIVSRNTDASFGAAVFRATGTDSLDGSITYFDGPNASGNVIPGTSVAAPTFTGNAVTSWNNFTGSNNDDPGDIMGIGTLDGSAGIGTQAISSFRIDVTADTLFASGTQFNFTFDGTPDDTLPIPEPSGTLLALLGALALGSVRNRK